MSTQPPRSDVTPPPAPASCPVPRTAVHPGAERVRPASITPLRRRLLLKAFKLSDPFLAVAAFCLTMVLFYQLPGTRPVGPFGNVVAPTMADFLALQTSIRHVLLFLALLCFWHVSFVAFRLYDSRRLSSRTAEVGDIIRATSLGTAALAVADLVFRLDLVNGVFIGLFWIVSMLLTIATRYTLRLVLAQVRLRGRNRRHVLIVGLNERTARFARHVESRPELGYVLVGFVDDHWPGQEQFAENGWRPLASLPECMGFVTNQVVDEVVVGLPMKSLYGTTARIVQQCGEQGIIVRLLSDFFDTVQGAARSDLFEEEALVTITPEKADGFSQGTKRVIDVVLATVALVALAPVFVITAILVKWTSPGPVFFVQERVGLNKRTFRLYKFRTMSSDAEARLAELEHLNEVKGPAFKMRNDPRVTQLGRLLRRTSIDELPQLLNVLKGDMSLVGPRPLPIRDVERFEEDWQRRRFSVRPGLTCLWQVSGRSRLSFERWMELDMEYIDEWSLFLDFKILARTVPAVLKGSGAV
jgi:exopolysaccharide biosynthesis polyprenyl glycosylphosphotransferase